MLRIMTTLFWMIFCGSPLGSDHSACRPFRALPRFGRVFCFAFRLGRGSVIELCALPPVPPPPPLLRNATPKNV